MYREEERKIMVAHMRRCDALMLAKIRRNDKLQAEREIRRKNREEFAELCEISEGRAVYRRQMGLSNDIMWHYADCPDYVLDTVVPLLHIVGMSDVAIKKTLPNEGPLAWLMHCACVLAYLAVIPSKGLATCAIVPLMLGELVRTATKAVASLQHRARRPIYYDQERARRQMLAVERRRIRRRSTTNPCPSKEEIFDAWLKIHDSKESLIRFGSLLQDLECYLDNSLKFDDCGRITGRNRGIKGWLEENLPALHARYSTVIRYKCAAKKLRQIVGLSDPVPVEKVLCNYGADKLQEQGTGCGDESGDGCEYGGKTVNSDMEDTASTYNKNMRYNNHEVHCRNKDMRNKNTNKLDKDMRYHDTNVQYNHNENTHYYNSDSLSSDTCNEEVEVAIVRARAVYLEAMGKVPNVTSRVLARIDALCDPEQVNEAAMLSGWKEKYANAITVRNKKLWWTRLARRGSSTEAGGVDERRKAIA